MSHANRYRRWKSIVNFLGTTKLNDRILTFKPKVFWLKRWYELFMAQALVCAILLVLLQYARSYRDALISASFNKTSRRNNQTIKWFHFSEMQLVHTKLAIIIRAGRAPVRGAEYGYRGYRRYRAAKYPSGQQASRTKLFSLGFCANSQNGQNPGFYRVIG